MGITMLEYKYLGPMTGKYPPAEKIDSRYEEVTQSYKLNKIQT